MIIADTIDLGTSRLVSMAFEKSWQFVRTDPELAHIDVTALRAQLAMHLKALANNGERDVWQLANGAIRELRRQHVRFSYHPAA